MAKIRTRGEDISLVLVRNGTPKADLTNVRSLNLNFEIDTPQEGYLGKHADDFDEVFRGISGDFDLHVDSPEALDAFDEIIQKAQRRDPTAIFNLKTSINFPGRGKRRYILQDIHFGSVPFTFGSRSDYFTVKLSFKCSNYSRL